MANETLQAAPITINRTAIADRVFEELQHQILSLELKPGTKISETDVAKVFGISRQPVRNAFFRLSRMGFLDVRPQVASRISFISEEAVLQARFIRCAIETKAVRFACAKLSTDDLDYLGAQLGEQKEAVDAKDADLFHKLDEEFHREIYARAGLGFAWDLIKENKAHMDRVRYLSLPLNLDSAYQYHVKILAALKAKQAGEASKQMDEHLSQIFGLLERVRAEYPEHFVPLEDDINSDLLHPA